MYLFTYIKQLFEYLKRNEYLKIFQSSDFELKQTIFNTNGTILIMGKRYSGKTSTAKSLYYEYSENVDQWFSFCGSKPEADDWKKVLESQDNVKIASQESLNFLRDLMDKQKNNNEKKEKIGLIFDGVTSIYKFMYNPELKEIFNNGRHYNFFIIVTAVYMKHIPPCLRENIDYLIMSKLSEQTKQIIFREIIQNVKDYNIFNEMYKKEVISKLSPTSIQICKPKFQSLVYENVTEKFTIYKT